MFILIVLLYLVVFIAVLALLNIKIMHSDVNLVITINFSLTTSLK